MAYIKTLKDNELIGGQDNTDVYPITSTQAVYSQKENGSAPEGKKVLLEERLTDMESQIEDLIDTPIGTDSIADEAIVTRKIADNAITTSKIDNGAVTSEKIASNAVTNDKIANGTITGDKFTDDSIDGSKIKDNSVPGSKLADGAIESIDLQDNTLSGSKLADNSVDGDKLVDGAITNNKLKDNSIDGSKIADGTIQSLDIKDGTISGAKLANNTITGDKLADGIIDNNKIANNSITGDKFLDESISGEKIQPNTIHGSKLETGTVDGADIINGTLNGNKITDLSVDGNKLADDSIETRHIKSNTISGSKIVTNSIDSTKIRNNSLIGDNFASGAITNDKIVDDSVTNEKIANNTITSAKIADGAITTNKLVNSSIEGTSIADNAITNAKLQDDSIVNRNIATGTLTGDKFADNTITGDKIIDNTIPGSKIKDGTIENVDIKDNTLSGAKLVDNSISGSKIADNAITSAHLLDNSIPASKILDGTIESIDIKDGTLDGSKVKDNTITGAKLADNGVTSDKIVNSSITTDKIGNLAVTEGKIVNSAVTEDKISNGAVTENKLGTGSVITNKIADGSVTETKLGTGAVTANKIVDNSVTTAKLSDGAVTTSKIADSNVTTDKIADLNVTTAKLADSAVTEDKLADGAITSDKIADDAITELQTIMDEVPTAGSVKPVQSGGVQNELVLGVVYDVSAKNSTAGPSNDGKWESLSTLLSDANLNTLIPTSVRKGGMSIKFVQSSDNKYVQYRFMLSTFTAAQFTNATNWQGMDDKPAVGSRNLIESGGVFNNLMSINGSITINRATSGGSIGSWGLAGKNILLGGKTYNVLNTEDSAAGTSFYLYDEQGNQVYTNQSIAKNRTITITPSVDIFKITGYTGGKTLNIIITENDNMLSLLNDAQNTLLDVQNEVWSIDGAFTHIYIAPQSGSNVGPWRVGKDFKAGTYLIKNAIGSHGSIIFYAQDGSEIYRKDSIPRDATFSVVLQQDAVRVGGYNPIADSITDIIIVGKDTMESRLETIEENKDICILNPPSQYDSLIYNNNRSKRIDNNLKKLFTLVHFSDIHGMVDNVARLSKFVGRYKSEIDDIICTGDIVADRYEDTNILDNYPNILTLIGNHDAWLRTYDAELAEYQAGPWVVKQSYCYDKFIANNVANWEVTQPSDVETTKKCYYYKDYQQADSKLRVICLDCMHYNIGADLDTNNNSIQNAWLSDVLTDAKNNNIPVVIAVHYWPSWVSLANEEVIKCAYSNTDSIGSDYLPSIAIQTVQSFIDNGGEFVCWIAGHAHCDLIAAPRDYPKQMFITVDCATYVNSVGDSARVKNTKSQDCFNIITFDTYDKLVKVVRAGSDTTRQLKQKRVLAYRYAPITDDAGVLHNVGLEYCG